MNKVIQIANICKEMCNVPNPIPGRVYYSKGCSPAINTCRGRVENTDVFMDKAEVKIRYAIGRTNKPNEWSGKSGTANFHVNPVFACVTATQWSNRGANS